MADTITLTIPVDLPPGRYPVEVGLYDAADPAFRRVPLADGETGDFIILTEIEVVHP